MEMANFTSFYTHIQQHQLPSLNSLKPFIYFCNYSYQFHHNRCFVKASTTRFKRKPFSIIRCSTSHLKDSANNNNADISNNNDDNIWADSEFVEVIGIGSRVDSVLDFCLQSPSSSNSLRFWNVIKSESLRGQLRQRSLGKDKMNSFPPFSYWVWHLLTAIDEQQVSAVVDFLQRKFVGDWECVPIKFVLYIPYSCPNIVEAPFNSQSHSKTVVLVATAGYGDDYVLAAEILRNIRCGDGIVIAVVLKPFSFEGQRRQDEVKTLVDKLQDCVDFCIDVDIDTLLKMDLVTLDEALKTAYRAVSTAITAVSILGSDRHQKYIHSLLGSMRRVTVAEVRKVLDVYKEGRVGFGVGQNAEASIVQAVYDCPFLSMGLKDLDGVVICVLTSSSSIGDSDVNNLLRTFRKATECTKEVILSVVQNPNMKPNMIASTVITVGNAEGKSLQKSSILSRLADSIPFVFNFLRRNNVEPDNSRENNLRENIFPPMLSNFADQNEVPEMMVTDEDAIENLEMYSGEKIINKNRDEEYDDGKMEKVGHLDGTDSFKYIEQNFQGVQASDEKPFINRNVGPGYRVIQEWHEEELTEAVLVADNPKPFHLPVGVKLSEQLPGSFDKIDSRWPTEKFTDENSAASPVPSVSPLNGFTDLSFEVVSDIWSTASTLLKRKDQDVPEKQGLLSARAASMLESERDSKTRWSPVTKIRYRGGVYKGRCQGGLPEGKGRLTFQDGSVYDGMWRYGKRSGLGSLFFSNGDVFHGSWRDDLMHGKGWLYFHTGERWFVNFWKGRPNGEGRFYSKSGEVFFGQFQDGWRDGRFLCVKVDGTRCVEIWNEGILISTEEMEM